MKDMKKKLQKLSLISLITAIGLFGIAFYFFHFVTDSGFTLTYHEEAGKPFVTDLIGQFAVLFLFTSVISLIIAKIFYSEEN